MVKHGYSPTEQYMTQGKLGPWTDVYAVCATIYRCLTGHVPVEAVYRVSDQGLKSISSYGIKVDQAWELNLMKGLAIKPEERYQDMDELHRALYSEPGVMETGYVQAGSGTEKLVETKRNAKVIEESHTEKKKRNLLILLICVCAIVLLIAGSGYLVMK